MYGGAAGGGKSDAMLMAALQYVDLPHYNALLLRRTYADLALAGALMDRASEWLQGTAAQWKQETKTWTFPSGATLAFGYLEIEKHKYRYQGSEYQFIGFDELTQFPESQYTYLFSRLRQSKEAASKGVKIPLRMRSATNPGGEGQDWVYRRFFVDGRASGRVFIPAKLDDNPHLDQVEYTRSLSELDDITKAQLLEGLWISDPSQKPYDPTWWAKGKNRYHVEDTRLANQVLGRWISFDTGIQDKETSAFTAAVVVELLPDYRLLLRHVWRDKVKFPALLKAIQDLAKRWNQDGKLRAVIIEDKASGTSAFQSLSLGADPWLQAILVAFTPKTDKLTRAKQVSIWASRDCFLFPHPSQAAPWLLDFENELYGFPHTVFADQVDAFNQMGLYLENLIALGWQARANPQAAGLEAGDLDD
jgi:predicted phage terminase large subunit-like protein